jgi:hypothetical protein
MSRCDPNGEPMLPQMPNDAASEKAGSPENGNERLVHGTPVQFHLHNPLTAKLNENQQY